MNQQLGISVHGVGIDYVLNKNFKRLQLCHKFSGAKEITTLLKFSKKYPLKVVYHAPVFYQHDPTVSYYLHGHRRLRDANFDILEDNLRMAKSLPTDYVIVHLTSKQRDLSLDRSSTLKIAKESVLRLNDLAAKYGVMIHLEYTMDHPYFYEPEDWVEVIKDCEHLGLCLDIGYLKLGCQRYGLNYDESFEALLPLVKSVHLWNTRGVEDFKKYGHVPVHPDQELGDGWLDIEAALEHLLGVDIDMPIIFEPDFEYADLNYIEEGIDWVNGMVYTIREAYQDELRMMQYEG